MLPIPTALSTSGTRAWILGSLLLAACGGTAPADEASLNHRIRQARAHAAPGEAHPILSLRGPCTVAGAQGHLELTVDGSGRFRLEVRGPAHTAEVFDGDDLWTLAPDGTRRRALGPERELKLLSTWVMAGCWNEPGLGLDLEGVRVEDGVATGRLSTRSTPPASGHWRAALPEGDLLEFTNEDARGSRLRFSDYRRSGEGRHPVGRAPGRVELLAGERVMLDWRIEEVSTLSSAGDLFQPPLAEARGRFTGSESASVRALLSPSGHLFVEALLDGSERGWFALDSGAAGTVLDRSTAEALGHALEEATPFDAQGEASSELVVARSLELGPLRFDDLPVRALDLSSFQPGGGLRVAGLLGCDVLRGAVWELDWAAGGVRLHPPGSAPAAPAPWSALGTHFGQPTVEVVVEGRPGRFLFDTGSPLALIVNAPAVAQRGLLARATTPAPFEELGLVVEAEAGTLDAVRALGQGWSGVSARLVTEAVGRRGDAALDGVFGMGLLQGKVLWLDLSRGQAALGSD